MPNKAKGKPYKIVGAYDSETSNIYTDIGAYAFPILHQIGLIDTSIEDITADNVERETAITLFRHTFELTAWLDEFLEQPRPYVPVLCCHNLSFDMYPLASWLSSHNTRVLAKSRQKPITFTIRDEQNNPLLVIWDTLVFSSQPLAQMGRDCGYEKLVGEWDYNLVRTPETPLSEQETAYAEHDIYSLLAWLGWWCRRNPDIKPQKLGLNVVTKTGIVRERRKTMFDQLQGRGLKYNIGRYWLWLNRTEAPKTDDELFVMHACTRGGFTFCSSSSAGVPYDLRGSGLIVAGYDATSQHPGQMASHTYPVGFHEAGPETLQAMFELIQETPIDDIFERWISPFGVAFNALFEFTNLRPKKGSIYERWGVLPLASARITGVPEAYNEDNEAAQLFRAEIREQGYTDTAINPRYAFGKLINADLARLYITELAAWEICQCYEWDEVRAIKGYCTSKFVRPTDMAIASVCTFYRAKNEFKRAMGEWEKTGTITNDEELKRLGIADTVILGMKHGTMDEGEIKQYYQLTKSNLNALFGIEASNEYRQATTLTSHGIEYEGGAGICNAPKNPKAWYAFGQRVVGWSRIAQICVMELGAPYCERVINGDTDSVKFLVERDNIGALSAALDVLSQAIDKGKAGAMQRFQRCYPEHYDELRGIGHYELEFTSERFCASWNKAYLQADNGYKFTLAGVPARRGLNEFAEKLEAAGWSFEQICSLILGFNITLAYDLTGLNARSFPEWGSSVFARITDYSGNTSLVTEPHALALYPMPKTLNSLSTRENMENYQYVVSNNPNINVNDVVLTWGDGKAVILDVNNADFL